MLVFLFNKVSVEVPFSRASTIYDHLFPHQHFQHVNGLRKMRPPPKKPAGILPHRLLAHEFNMCYQKREEGYFNRHGVKLSGVFILRILATLPTSGFPSSYHYRRFLPFNIQRAGNMRKGFTVYQFLPEQQESGKLRPEYNKIAYKAILVLIFLILRS